MFVVFLNARADEAPRSVNGTYQGPPDDSFLPREYPMKVGKRDSESCPRYLPERWPHSAAANKV